MSLENFWRFLQWMENDTSLDYPPSPRPRNGNHLVFIISTLMASLSPVLCSSVRVSGADSDYSNSSTESSELSTESSELLKESSELSTESSELSTESSRNLNRVIWNLNRILWNLNRLLRHLQLWLNSWLLWCWELHWPAVQWCSQRSPRRPGL